MQQDLHTTGLPIDLHANLCLPAPIAGIQDAGPQDVLGHSEWPHAWRTGLNLNMRKCRERLCMKGSIHIPLLLNSEVVVSSPSSGIAIIVTHF